MSEDFEAIPEPLKPPRRVRSIFWSFFWLLPASILLKWHYMNSRWPYREYDRRADWRDQLYGILQRDAAFIIMAAVICGILLFITRPLRRTNAFLYFLIRLFALLCLIYTFIAHATFEFTQSWPTVSMISQLGGWKAPLWQHASRELKIALAIAIPSYLILVAICNRLLRPKRDWAMGVSALLALGAIFCYWRFADVQNWRFYRNRHDSNIFHNPHWTMLKSIARSFPKPQWAREGPLFEQDHLSDFAPASQRPDRGAPTSDLPRGPTNIIVINLESVATRYLTIYGSEFPTTPMLAAEAQHALVFDNFYSHVTNSWNSLYAMLLGIYPPLSWREASITRPNYPAVSLANVLHDRGYRTAFISASTNAWNNGDKFLANRGFDVIQDHRDSGCTPISDWGVEDRCMIDMILRFIDGSQQAAPKEPGQKPFFIFGWSNQTHYPYEPSPGQTEIDFLKGDKTWGNMWWDLGRYLNAISEADRQISRLLSELRKRNLADSTLVIITGDHGEGMGKPHPYYGHSGKLYQEDVNVPLIIWSPALFKSAQRSKTIGAHIDLAPTILDFLNIALPPNWQGRSLMSPHHPQRAYFYGSADEYLLGVREANLKYILNTTRDSDQLFDLSTDPTEQKNLAPQLRTDANRLRQRTAAWLKSMLR